MVGEIKIIFKNRIQSFNLQLVKLQNKKCVALTLF